MENTFLNKEIISVIFVRVNGDEKTIVLKLFPETGRKQFCVKGEIPFRF